MANFFFVWLVDVLNFCAIESLKISSFSPLFESFMAIGFGFFALTRKDSRIVVVLESPIKKIISSLKEFEESLNKKPQNRENEIDTLELKAKVSTIIGEKDAKMNEIMVDIRYNFLCLAAYCLVMLICCGVEDLFWESAESAQSFKSFVFNFSILISLNFRRRIKVYDSAQDEKVILAKELGLYFIAIIISILCAWLLNSPIPMLFIFALIIFSIFIPVIIHLLQYRNLRKEVIMEESKLETTIYSAFKKGLL